MGAARVILRRLHYSPGPFVLDRSRTYEPPINPMHGKPNGLWYSIEPEPCPQGWKSWRSLCEGDGCRTDNLAVRTELALDEARILCVAGDIEGLRALSQTYPAPDSECTKLRRHHLRAFGLTFGDIDWVAIARSWAGFEIAPFDEDIAWAGGWWYRTLDCSSGCVWDLSAVRSVAPA